MIKKNFLAKGNYLQNSLIDLRKRIGFVLLSILVFRIGSFIPVPGVNTVEVSRLLSEQHGTIMDMFNMFSGGSLSRSSIFALGIMPNISASIIIQLLALIVPFLSEMKKDGEEGRKKINQITRYMTLVLAFFQSVGISISLPYMLGRNCLVLNPSASFYIVSIVSLVTGTVFLMWIGDIITENGIGNGISTIIFVGIMSGLPSSFANTFNYVKQGNLSLISLFFVFFIIFLTIFIVVLIEKSQRKIIVNYARRLHQNKIFSPQNSHLPLKINMAGVIPAIFASSIILFPTTILSWFGNEKKVHFLVRIATYLQPNRLVYCLLHTLAIVFFCFFYTDLVFNPQETAENLKKSGAFIAGIRPGIKTAEYIRQIMFRLTSIGSIYIAFICLIPDLMQVMMKVPFYFGGTSLLITVVVIMDFINHIQTILMSGQYRSILKKSNLSFKNKKKFL